MKLDIARAWKDEAYRQSLSSEELALLPENPAGELELNDAELEAVHGGDWGNGGGWRRRGWRNQNQPGYQFQSFNCANSQAANCLNSQGVCNSFQCIQSAALCNNSGGTLSCNSFIGACNIVI